MDGGLISVGHLLAGVALTELPSWLLQGIGLGLLAAVMILLVNVLGIRYLDISSGRRARVDEHELRRSKVRAYLQAIGEPYIEAFPLATAIVDFWLPERAVAITFDPHDFFDLEAAGVTVILLEHEVPGAAIGSRLPFDTPPLERTRPAGDERSWALETLGIDTESPDRDAIDRAYRERVLEAHPDRGGDADALADVILAHEVLLGDVSDG